jgi:hypothetical protein
MKNLKVLCAAVAVLAVMLCLGPLALAQGKGKTPIWDLYENGKPVKWQSHKANPRFAIYDPEKNSNPEVPDTLVDDVVLDRETGLIWTRDANLFGEITWSSAILRCYSTLIANRAGFRLPTFEELRSLFYDDTDRDGIYLPPGHPFVNVQTSAYWTATTFRTDSSHASGMFFGSIATYSGDKSLINYAWPVRGGNPYATGNW